MIRWRNFLILALLLLLPARIGSEDDDDENENDNEGNDDEEGEDEVEPSMKDVGSHGGGNNGGDGGRSGGFGGGRRAPAVLAATQPQNPVTRTMRRPLECYVCSYKSDSFLRSCLDPTKFRLSKTVSTMRTTANGASVLVTEKIKVKGVHTMACHSVEDKCFTAVTSRGSSYDAVMRGCRSTCVATPETTCCSTDRCNNQAMAMPVIAPRALTESSKANKSIPPTVLFFVTILLVLQTVVKVAVV